MLAGSARTRWWTLAILLSGTFAVARTRGPFAQTPSLEPHTLAFRRLPQEEPLLLRRGARLFLLGLVQQPGRGDRVLCTELEGGEALEPVVLTGVPGRVVELTGAVSGDGELHAFWIELSSGAPVLTHAFTEAGAWQEPRPLEVGRDPLRAPAAVTDSTGQVWLAFEAECAHDGHPTRPDVFLASIGASGTERVLRVTDRALSDFEPSVCADDQQGLWLAWTRSTGIDYEVVARHFDSRNSEFGPEIPVTQDVHTDDHHPDIAWRALDGAWVAWDAWNNPQRGLSTPRQQADDVEEEASCTVRLARIAPDGAQWVTGLRSESSEAPSDGGEVDGVVVDDRRLNDHGGTPRLVLEPQGAIHVVHRSYPEPFADGESAYPVEVLSLIGGEATPPQRIRGSEGSTTPAALAWSDTEVFLAYDQSQRPSDVAPRILDLGAPELDDAAIEAEGLRLSWTNSPRCLGYTSFPRTAQRGAPPTAVPQPRSGPRPHPWPDPGTNPVLTGESHRRIEDGTHHYAVYWGDLHRHSNLSRCSNGREPGPDLRYTVARDLLGDEFFALTDHSGQVDIAEWWSAAKRVELYDAPDFRTFHGYEWSTQDYGHQNVIHRGRDDSVLSSAFDARRGPEFLWSMLTENDSICIPHHTAHEKLQFHFESDDPRFLRLIEVVQGRGSFEFPGCFRRAPQALRLGSFVHDALSLGRRVGLIGSTDHGNGACYAAVIAESLDRDAIFDALLARRVYASTTKGMLCDFRVGETLQGGVSALGDEDPRIRLDVAGTRELAEVVVFRDGEPWRIFGRPSQFEGSREMVLQLETNGREEGPRGYGQELALEIRSADASFTPIKQAQRGRSGGGFRRAGRNAVRFETENDGLSGWRDSRNELKVVAAADTVLEVRYDDVVVSRTVAELLETPLSGRFALSAARPALARRGLPFRLRINGGSELLVDPSSGMGSDRFHLDEIDQEPRSGHSWYAARAIQVDGEIVWSSPVFVERTGAPGADGAR